MKVIGARGLKVGGATAVKVIVARGLKVGGATAVKVLEQEDSRSEAQRR